MQEKLFDYAIVHESCPKSGRGEKYRGKPHVYNEFHMQKKARHLQLYENLSFEKVKKRINQCTGVHVKKFWFQQFTTLHVTKSPTKNEPFKIYVNLNVGILCLPAKTGPKRQDTDLFP